MRFPQFIPQLRTRWEPHIPQMLGPPAGTVESLDRAVAEESSVAFSHHLFSRGNGLMLGRLILLFLLTPAIELGLLIQIDGLIGFWPTIGLIVATGIAGSYLARREGLSAWRRLHERLRSGDLPGQELVDGVIILVAGALLVTPGVVTDIVGFLGLLPPTRAVIRRILIRRFRRKMEQGSMQVQFGIFGGAASPSGPVEWDAEDERAGNESGEEWHGQRHQIPGHTDNKPDRDDR